MSQRPKMQRKTSYVHHRPDSIKIDSPVSSSDGSPERLAPTTVDLDWKRRFMWWVHDFMNRGLRIRGDLVNQITSKFEDILISSVTHCSIEPDKSKNYDMFEFRGDSTVHYIISRYLFEKYGHIAEGEGQLTMTRSILVSQKTLANYCVKIGLAKMARVDASVLNNKRGIKLKALHEDIFEAFIGASETAIDAVLGELEGLRVWKRFLWGWLDREHIKLRYTETKYPKMKLKEFYDNVPWDETLIREFVVSHSSIAHQNVMHGASSGKNKNLNNWVKYTVVKKPRQPSRGEDVPDDECKFIVKLEAPIPVKGKLEYREIGRGDGYKRAEAENNAAAAALETLKTC